MKIALAIWFIWVHRSTHYMNVILRLITTTKIFGHSPRGSLSTDLLLVRNSFLVGHILLSRWSLDSFYWAQLIWLCNNRFPILVIHACSYSFGSKFEKRLLQLEQRQQRCPLVQQQRRRLRLRLRLLHFVIALIFQSVELPRCNVYNIRIICMTSRIN